MIKSVKLADIAEKVGVSTVTVSKALSGQKGVSEEMRVRIKELADELGYKQPSVARREAASQKSYQIGVLIEEGYLDKYESFYWLLYQHVSTYALAKECFTFLEVMSRQSEEQMDLPKLIKEQKADGIIVIGSMKQEFLKYLKQSAKVPVVYLDFTDGEPDTESIVSDSYYGAYRMTKYLLKQGHRDIAYVGTIQATGSIADRYFGYQKALLEAGIIPNPQWLLEDRDIGSGYIIDDLLQLPREMPTAFFCNCDLTAGIVIQKLKEKGYRVPEDISVAGFDNYIHPGICDIGITTYEVDQGGMAKLAVKQLLKRIADPHAAYGTHVVDGNMVIKESIKLLPK